MNEKNASTDSLCLPTYHVGTTAPGPEPCQYGQGQYEAPQTFDTMDNCHPSDTKKDKWDTIKDILMVIGMISGIIIGTIATIYCICLLFTSVAWLFDRLPFPETSLTRSKNATAEAAQSAVEEYKQSVLAAQVKAADGLFKLQEEVQRLREVMEMVKTGGGA